MKTLFAIAFAGITATAVVGCAHKQEAAPTTPANAPAADAGAAAPESAPAAPEAAPANRPPPN
jgi:hypothetical protein